MKSRSFFVYLGLLAVLLLSIGTASWYDILSQSPLPWLKGGVATNPAAALFVPRQAPLMLSMVVNPEKLAALGLVQTPYGKRRETLQELQQAKTSLMSATGLDYTKQIEPWLGNEISFAVTTLDVDRNLENGVTPGYLLVVEARDKELAKEFLQLAYTEQALAPDSGLRYETYKGVNLVIPDAKTKQFASAIVGNYVLFASEGKVLRSAINTVQVPDLNLSHDPQYLAALETIDRDHIGIAVANLPALSAWIANDINPEEPTLKQRLAVTLSLQNQGLIAETALIGDTEPALNRPILTEPVEALTYVPPQALLAVAGRDLKQLWTDATTGLNPRSPLSQILQQSVVAIQEPLGIDLPADIFDWISSDYALAIVPNLDRKNSVDWLFVAEREPEVNIDPIIEHFDELAQEKGLSVGRLPLGDRQVTAWTAIDTSNQDDDLVQLNAQVQGAHLSVENYELFASSVKALSRAVNANKKQSLLDNKNFKVSLQQLPSENGGYLYADWRQGAQLFKTQVPILRVVDYVAKPFFNHLNSLSLTSSGNTEDIRRSTLFFTLSSDRLEN
ncbi:DUF3352 domain-containing protein [[Limnothrix rosea] IAM M-220]|uniref:DUF3352 domain-containing protein n=1 Tax=[Limnothrix rosea] IAM M-220 TaxID=454133 RepID=UPI00095F3D4D|nr:DUF3352 domain-containing protein [[Limnothrix rosea] IAM M-220]OKH17060.1 hypothetical protein NIES208_10705 [[Limnothrix rosea] IAM M-220]